MQKLFNEYVSRRCCEALRQNAKYMKEEEGGKTPEDELQCMSENICYIQGLKDALSFFKNM